MGELLTMEKGRSPFSPGQPVSPDMFVGRHPQIARMLRSFSQIALGKQENLFVTGEYGIGKSSLISYVRQVGEREKNVIGFHVFLGGVSTLETLVQQVVSRIIQHSQGKGVWDCLKDLLGRYVEQVELFKVKLNLSRLKKDAPSLAHDFLPFLRRLWEKLGKHFDGMALFLDDLNGITRTPEFAAFIKSLVDEIATSGEELPLLLALSGVPERRMEILANQPSVARIFDIIEVNPLENDEVSDFFVKAYASVNMSVEKDALQHLVFYSGGLPKLMHELGDAVYWINTDDIVQRKDVVPGIITAADIVGRKYFEPIREALHSVDYHSILKKLGSSETGLEISFKKADLAKGLSETEQKKLANFLNRMKKLHALFPGESRGEWVFPNRLVRLYLLLESSKENRS
ncbi:MAG: ATP-binding protein [Phycisphaerae bacterium]|nr:ATP-binding protein [Phycisphaerae bacterium]